MIIHQKAKGKINLHLEVGNRNPDSNLHDLCATYNFVQFCDFIAMSIEKEASDPSEVAMNVRLSPKLIKHFDFQKRSKESFIKDICKNDSLVKKSISEFFKTYKLDQSQYTISLDVLKCIPDMSGLGGGSSDAAATLRSLVLYFNVDDDNIFELCEKLGSDVYPCYLSYLNKTILQTGSPQKTNFKLLKTASNNKYNILLLKPPSSTNTKDAYKNLNREPKNVSAFKLTPDKVENELENLLSTPYAKQHAVATDNDFLKANIEAIPEIEKAISICNELGSVHTSITGSGSCLYALFPKVDYAQKCYFEIDKNFNKTWWQTITFFK